MAVIATDVAVELGRPTPLPQSESDRYSSWIDRAERMIRRRATSLGVAWGDVDPDTLDDVVLLAVTRHARNPDGIESYDVSVDDAREMRRYRSGSGELTITDQWWGWLFPGSVSGAFSVRPYGEPDGVSDLAGWS